MSPGLQDGDGHAAGEKRRIIPKLDTLQNLFNLSQVAEMDPQLYPTQQMSHNSRSKSTSSSVSSSVTGNQPIPSSGPSSSLGDVPSAASLQAALMQDPHFTEAVRDVLSLFSPDELSSEPFLKQYVTEQLARWGRWTQRGRTAAVCFEAACVGALRSLQKRGLVPTELTARADQALARCLAGMVIDAVEPLAMEHGGAVREKAIGIVADEFLARAASPRIANSAKRRVKKRQSGFRNSGGFPSDGEQGNQQSPKVSASSHQSDRQNPSSSSRPVRSPDRKPPGMNVPPTRKTSASSSPYVSPMSSPRMGMTGPPSHHGGSQGILPNGAPERKRSIPGRDPTNTVQLFGSATSVGGAGGGAEARARARARRAHEQQKEQQQQYLAQSSPMQRLVQPPPQSPVHTPANTNSGRGTPVPQYANYSHPAQQHIQGYYQHPGNVYPPTGSSTASAGSAVTGSSGSFSLPSGNVRRIHPPHLPSNTPPVSSLTSPQGPSSSSRTRQNTHPEENSRMLYQSVSSQSISSGSTSGNNPVSSSEYWRQRSGSTPSVNSSSGNPEPDYGRIHSRRGSQEHAYHVQHRRPSEEYYKTPYSSAGDDSRLYHRRPSDTESTSSSHYRRGMIEDPQQLYNVTGSGAGGSPIMYRRPSADNSQPLMNNKSSHRRPSLEDSQNIRSGNVSPAVANIPQSSNSMQSSHSSSGLGPAASSAAPFITSRKTSLDGPPAAYRKASEDKAKGGLSDLLQSIMDECEDYQENLHRH